MIFFFFNNPIYSSLSFFFFLLLPRFLEKHGENISVVFVVRNSVDLAAYDALLKLYFPRTKEEEKTACISLPRFFSLFFFLFSPVSFLAFPPPLSFFLLFIIYLLFLFHFIFIITFFFNKGMLETTEAPPASKKDKSASEQT